MGKLGQELNNFMFSSERTVTNIHKIQESNEVMLKELLEKTETIKMQMDGSMEKLTYKVGKMVTIEDMKVNFKQFNDLLFINFRTIEDTKEACRNMIAYQKYFHPIQTQNMITETCMSVAAIRNDEEFISHQKRVFIE